MPKTTHHYYFRAISDKETHVTKFDANQSEPLVTYIVIEEHGYNTCDCPASRRGYLEPTHKHIAWVKRWKGIIAKGQHQAVYYDDSIDRFFPIAGLDDEPMAKLNQKPSDEG